MIYESLQSKSETIESVEIGVRVIARDTCITNALQEIITSISLRLPNEVVKRLENLSKLTGRTKTHDAIETFCQHLGDLEDIYISESHLEEMRAGKVRPLSLHDPIDNQGVDTCHFSRRERDLNRIDLVQCRRIVKFLRDRLDPLGSPGRLDRSWVDRHGPVSGDIASATTASFVLSRMHGSEFR